MNQLALKSPKIKPSSKKNTSKSPSKTPTKSPLRSSSPSPKKKIIKQDEDFLTEKMSKLRQKICGTLDAYILIFRTDSPMRCLQHNSVLSLYCQTQQKLLCANCVYKNANHKMHKVYPIQKCYQQISRDIDLNSKKSNRQINWINNTINSIHNFLNNQQKYANNAIISLAKHYDQLQNQLINNFQTTRKNILLTIEQLNTKKQQLLLQLQFYKQTITNNHIQNYPNFNLENIKNTNQENQLIYHHLISNTIIQYAQFDNFIIDHQSKILKITQKYINNINHIINLISNQNSIHQSNFI